MQKIADVKFASGVLQWDQETYMPEGGAALRGRQIATLSEVAHALFTDSETGNLLTELASRANLDSNRKKNIERSRYDFERDRKLSADFVNRLSLCINECFHAWLEARKKNAFRYFEKPLTQLIDLKKKQADLLGYTHHPYDALMDEFDQGLTVADTDIFFEQLKEKLKPLLDKIMKAQEVDNSLLHQHFDRQKQWDFGIGLLKDMHYDFSAGRQDISEHPFTIHFGNRDVRITTRIDENDFGNMTWSCLHEGGHALYEQGLPEKEYGLPLGTACSLSIHESQSRIWENNIGRSLAYWSHHFPGLKKLFPEQLRGIDVERFFSAINKVAPSLIRTEADELTYHFHVMIRYEIEKELISGALTATSIPERWNQAYYDYLGVRVKDDVTGCLQDVHWSHGSFGYFPTYSLGSLYASQFFEAAKNEYPELDTDIQKGNTKSLWRWLQTHIYPFGRYYLSGEICENATEKKLNIDTFISYVKNKYSSIYNL